jgi:thiosulfate/3-mercaptopyruvate sulfurtransferase
VLDGGYPAWVAASHPVTRETPSLPVAQLDLAGSWARTIDRQGVVDRLGDLVLLDARAGPRYRGETEPIDPLPGHIPTAVNAPTDGNLGADGRLLDAAALAERFRVLGVNGSTPVVTSCGSGVAACFNSLAMRVAGLPDPILYPGSYSDWSRAGLPVAVGADPGAVPESLRPRRPDR